MTSCVIFTAIKPHQHMETHTSHRRSTSSIGSSTSSSSAHPTLPARYSLQPYHNSTSTTCRPFPVLLNGSSDASLSSHCVLCCFELVVSNKIYLENFLNIDLISFFSETFSSPTHLKYRPLDEERVEDLHRWRVVSLPWYVVSNFLQHKTVKHLKKHMYHVLLISSPKFVSTMPGCKLFTVT